MNTINETTEKERRVRTMLEGEGCGSLVVTRRENFSWLSCGGQAVTSHIAETSPVYLLVTPTRKYAVGYNMDVPRTMDEELAGQGFEPVALPTFGKSMAETVRELAEGKLAADGAFPGAVDLGAAVTGIHEPFLPQEMARYRAVAQESGEIVQELAQWVEPGMTEQHVLAHMWGLYLEHGFEGDCMFVVSDDRIQRYRHAIPSGKPIEGVVILAPAVFKQGLHVAISRMVFFREPTADQRRRFQAVAAIQAAMVASSTPGTKLTGMLQRCFGLFESLGFPEERSNHWHGGPTGYRVSYPERTQDPSEEVRPGMAFSWYITVRGAKSEELILVDGQGAQLASVDPAWPRLQVETGGQVVAVPDLLVR